MKRILILLMAAFLVTGCAQAKENVTDEMAAAAVVETQEAIETAESEVETEAAEADSQTAETEAETENTVPESEAGPEPIYAEDLVDGFYEITVDSSSSMFRVVECVLTVENGQMSAVMTMSGNGYGMVYMGTGEEALADSEENYVPFVLNENEMKDFTVPVEALDMEVDCAAWSIRKEKWYDRILVFESENLPAEAFKAE